MKILCIDIGASKMHALLFQERFIEAEYRLVTPQGKRGFLKVLKGLINQAQSKGKLDAMGIGIAGVVDAKNGKLIFSPRLKFMNGFNLLKWAGVIGRCRVVVENDARAFVIGEKLLGAGKKSKSLVGVTLGTGVGSGLIINERIWKGHTNSAGEIGHMFVELTPRIKEFEFLAGMSYFGESLDIFKGVPYHKIRKIPRSLIRKFDRYAYFLAAGLANIINIINPEMIVLGGGLSKLSRFYLPKTKVFLSRIIFSGKRNSTKIRVSFLGDRAIPWGLWGIINKRV